MIEKLGWSFVEKARESFDPGFYKLAEQCALCLESKQDEDRSAGQSADRPLSTPRSIRSAALLLRGHVLHNLHRFSEAEKIARELVELRGLAYDFGLLGDVMIEQGRTDDAALAYQKMMEMRPGPQAYSRAAHLRWLKGDTEGARALMLMSAQAAGQTESAAWAWSKLAIYELQTGEMKRAHAVCDAALRTRPDYAPALLARGRILLAENRIGEAVAELDRAARLNPLPEYQWALADALRVANRDADAAEVEQRLDATGPVRLAGNGPNDANNPDDMGFSRLSIFGGDILESPAAGHPFRLRGEFLGLPAGKFFVPGGWPNGRRFGDDVLDIAIIALISDLRDPANLKIFDPLMGNYDGVTGNELGFNKVFPYESTPQNGRKIIGFAQ